MKETDGCSNCPICLKKCSIPQERNGAEAEDFIHHIKPCWNCLLVTCASIQDVLCVYMLPLQRQQRREQTWEVCSCKFCVLCVIFLWKHWSCNSGGLEAGVVALHHSSSSCGIESVLKLLGLMYCGVCEDRRRFGGVKRWGVHCACSVPGIEHLHLAGSGESSLLHFSELQNLDWKRHSKIIESNHPKGLYMLIYGGLLEAVSLWLQEGRSNGRICHRQK